MKKKIEIEIDINKIFSKMNTSTLVVPTALTELPGWSIFEKAIKDEDWNIFVSAINLVAENYLKKHTKEKAHMKIEDVISTILYCYNFDDITINKIRAVVLSELNKGMFEFKDLHSMRYCG